MGKDTCHTNLMTQVQPLEPRKKLRVVANLQTSTPTATWEKEARESAENSCLCYVYFLRV